MEQLLKVENLCVSYHANREIVHAVNNVSFELEKGENLGLVGESGAGKTTTAISILRLLPQRTGFIDSGKIIFDGENLLDISEKKMRMVRGSGISMIFQDPMTSLNPVYSVGEQIYEVLKYHNYDKKPKAQLLEKVENMLELVGIPSSRKNEYPHQFSGGMKQRIGIAMALACEPKLLIADEPTTALDVTIQAQVLAMMEELKDKIDTSIIFITHDLGIVAKMCQKVAIMYAGEIIEYGTAHDIYKGKNHHPYTVGLFGSIPNLTDKKPRLDAIDGLMPNPTDLPKGCAFASRCKHKMEICDTEHPHYNIDNTHKIMCHLYNGEAENE